MLVSLFSLCMLICASSRRWQPRHDDHCVHSRNLQPKHRGQRGRRLHAVCCWCVPCFCVSVLAPLLFHHCFDRYIRPHERLVNLSDLPRRRCALCCSWLFNLYRWMQYCPQGASVVTQCPAGQYNSGTGGQSNTACQNCLAGVCVQLCVYCMCVLTC